jgi:hypothetical protein
MVCAHGGTAAYKRLRGAIQQGLPMVMLYNTGGVTQAFCSVHRGLTAKKDDGTTPTSNEILSSLEVVSSEKWAQSFGLPEIMLMQELNHRAPLLFKKTIVSVDVVKDTADHVLGTVTGCFANQSGGIPELGLGAAEAHVVLNAWMRFLTVQQSSRRFRRRADALYLTLVFVNLLTALGSVMYASYSLYDFPMSKSHLQLAVIVLPIASAFLQTVRTRMRNTEKAGICQHAAAKILSEIYAFRARVGTYDPAGCV